MPVQVKNNSNLVISLNKKINTDHRFEAMNYKYIISGPPSDEFFEYAKGILNRDNVGIVAKFLKNLPPSINFSFNSSKFYTSWLLNSFFNVSVNIRLICLKIVNIFYAKIYFSNFRFPKINKQTRNGCNSIGNF